jgi:hypothetical protein
MTASTIALVFRAHFVDGQTEATEIAWLSPDEIPRR